MKKKEITISFKLPEDIAIEFNRRFQEIGGGTTIRINHQRRNKVLSRAVVYWLNEFYIDHGITEDEFDEDGNLPAKSVYIEGMEDWSDEG